MGLLDDLAGITQHLPGGVIARGIISGEARLLGGSDTRDYDPVTVTDGEQAGEPGSGQRAGPQVALIL